MCRFRGAGSIPNRLKEGFIKHHYKILKIRHQELQPVCCLQPWRSPKVLKITAPRLSFPSDPLKIPTKVIEPHRHCMRRVRFGSFRGQSILLCVLQRVDANRIVMVKV